MASFHILYGTSEGQTAKIADRVAETITGRGHATTVADVSSLPDAFSLEDADAVVVGSSIHLGKHQKAVVSVVESHREELMARPSGFFQVSLSSAVDEEEQQAEAARYVEEFVETTDWHPDRIARFGGALRYSKYGFLKRLALKRIAKDATGDTDTSRDYEYTDWDEVAAFANDFAAFVEGRLGRDFDPDSE